MFKDNFTSQNKIDKPAPVKGNYNELCYRSACDNTHAKFYNFSTMRYYCGGCARMINDANRIDAVRLYGHDLCLEEHVKEFVRRKDSMGKSLEKFPVIKSGMYKGLWTAYNVVIIFKNGQKSTPIKLTSGVRGSNIDCDVFVDLEGNVYVE